MRPQSACQEGRVRPCRRRRWFVAGVGSSL